MRREGREIARLAGLLTTLALALPAVAPAATFDVNDDTTGPGPAGANCATPDFSSVAAAVTFAGSLPDGGADDAIRVCAGSYGGTVTIPASADGIDLLGAQAGVDARNRTAPDPDESLITASTAGTGGIVVNADGVTIDAFDIAAEDTGEGGIATAATTSGHQLVNNVLRSNSVGIQLDTDGTDQAVARHNLIASNNNASPTSGVGIFSDDGSSNVLIDENRFTGHTNAAVLLNAATAGTGVTISQNRLVDDNRIALARTTTATIEDNVSTGSQGSVVFLGGGNNGVTVRRNAISGSTESAVRTTATLAAAPNTDVTVTSNTILGNAFGIQVDDASMDIPLEAHFNRIFGNATGASNDDADPGDLVDAEDNWWGCTEGPGQTGCDDVTGNVDADPWLVLGLGASPTAIAATGAAQVSARLTRNSDNLTVGAGFPNGTPVGFTTTLGTIASPVATSGGVATTLLTGGGQGGTAAVSGALDNETATTALVINPPAEAAATAAKKKKCKKKKYREKHPGKCKKGKKGKKGKKRR